MARNSSNVSWDWMYQPHRCLVLFALAVSLLFTKNIALAGSDRGTSGNLEPFGELGEVIPLSALGKAAIGLNVKTVTKSSLPLQVCTTGKIESIPTKEYFQDSLLTGRVTEIKVGLGQSVKSGQVLAMMDSPEINQLASETLQNKSDLEGQIKSQRAIFDDEVRQSQSQYDYWQAQHQRFKKLFDEGIAAERDVQMAFAERRQAESRLAASMHKREANLAMLTAKLKISEVSLVHRLKQLGVSESEIKRMWEQQETILEVPVTSVRSGVITDVAAKAGQTIDRSTHLFLIADINTVWATGDIYEDDMARMRPGQNVRVKVGAFPGEVFVGKLSFIGKQVDPQTRTLPVRVEIANPGLKLRPDMFVEMCVDIGEATLAVIVPREAVIDATGHHIVFLETKGGYQAHFVKVGRSLGDNVEILDGLLPGERIVVRGAFQLNAEMLKSSGRKYMFIQPTEGERVEVHEEPVDTKKGSNSLSFHLIAVLLAIAFFGGFLISWLLAKLMKGTETKGVGKSTSFDNEPVHKG